VDASIDDLEFGVRKVSQDFGLRLMSVIVSHITMLFEAIGEHRELGEDLIQALVKA
jgi:hypothetical protein